MKEQFYIESNDRRKRTQHLGGFVVVEWECNGHLLTTVNGVSVDTSFDATVNDMCNSFLNEFRAVAI